MMNHRPSLIDYYFGSPVHPPHMVYLFRNFGPWTSPFQSNVTCQSHPVLALSKAKTFRPGAVSVRKVAGYPGLSIHGYSVLKCTHHPDLISKGTIEFPVTPCLTMYVDNPALFILKAAQRLAETRQIKKESFRADAAQEHNHSFLLLGTRG